MLFTMLRGVGWAKGRSECGRKEKNDRQRQSNKDTHGIIYVKQILTWQKEKILVCAVSVSVTFGNQLN